MNDRSAIFAYQKAAAVGSTPVGLVVALYDTILRDFRRALEAFDAGNIENRVFEMNHALSVIAHLQNTLDFDRGESAAKTFDRFYHVTRAMVVEANAKADRAAISQLIELYGGLRQAWQEVERKLPAGEMPRMSVPTRAAPASMLDYPEELPRGIRWNA